MKNAEQFASVFTHRLTRAIFLIQPRNEVVFNCESTAKICQHACSRRFKKLNFCDIRVIVLLQSYVIMLVGRLQGTEIKTEYLLAKK